MQSKTRNQTGYKGVYKTSNSESFRCEVGVRINGKTVNKHIGCYPTAKEASKARKEYIMSLI